MTIENAHTTDAFSDCAVYAGAGCLTAGSSQAARPLSATAANSCVKPNRVITYAKLGPSTHKRHVLSPRPPSPTTLIAPQGKRKFRPVRSFQQFFHRFFASPAKRLHGTLYPTRLLACTLVNPNVVDQKLLRKRRYRARRDRQSRHDGNIQNQMESLIKRGRELPSGRIPLRLCFEPIFHPTYQRITPSSHSRANR